MTTAKETRTPTTLARVGYLLRMYPRVSQTFVINEILELERQGVAVQIISLREPTEEVGHGSVSRVRAKVCYLPSKLAKRARRRAREQAALIRETLGSQRHRAATVLRETGATFGELLEAAYVLRWARQNGIDHVHVHFGTAEATVALLAHKLGGLSYSLTLHAFDIFRDNVDRALLARKINGSRFTITVSEFNRRFLLENMPGVNGDKIRVNYNGLDLTRLTAGHGEREELSILGVGRLIEKKGFLYLIRAVARLREEGMPVTCRIVGEGREAKTLAREIDALALSEHIELLGSLPQEQVLELTRRSHCFALPCIHAKDGNVDALPTVLLESLACGCPCVSTRVSGVPEIIEDGVSGLLVEPTDETALAGAIGRVLRDPALAARLAEAGLRRAQERFDIRRNVGRMHEWLSEAVVADAPGPEGPSC